MDHKLKLAILGGTGKSGRYLVRHLLSQQFPLKLLIRNPQELHLNNPLIELVQGNVRNYESVHDWIAGCHAVVSTLGQPRGESSIFSRATDNIIRAMLYHDVRRYIVTTGLNVDTPLDSKGPKTKLATEWMKSNYPETTRDKQIEFEILSKSAVDWTLVRLPLIEQTDERRKLIVCLDDCPGDKVSSTDLAYFLTNQLSDTTYIRKSPFVASG